MAPVWIVSRGPALHPTPTAAQPTPLHPPEWLLPLHSPSPLSNVLSRLSGPGLLESSHTPADFKPVIISSTAPLNCHWLFQALFPLFFSFSLPPAFSPSMLFLSEHVAANTLRMVPRGSPHPSAISFPIQKDLRKSTTPQTDTGAPPRPAPSTFSLAQ